MDANDALPVPDFRSLFTHGPGAYLILSPDLRIIEVNEAYLQATLTRRSDILGRLLFDVFPDNPDDPGADGVRNLAASLSRVLKHGHVDRMPIQKYDIRKPDNEGGGFEVRYWSPVNTPILNEDGRIRCIIHAATDVTEFMLQRHRHGDTVDPEPHQSAAAVPSEPADIEVFRNSQEVADINRRLQTAVAALEIANKELESFSYSVSHDLRAPLRAIDGFSRMLEHRAAGRLDDEDRRLLRVVRESSQTMGRLIDDLLHFSRVSRIVPQSRAFDMNVLVREVWQEVINDPYPGRIAFSPLPSITGDSALLRQVWSNLLSNAVKYSGHVSTPEIEVWGEIEDGEARYHVQDNGAGFNPRFSNKLFQVFQRLHTNNEFPGNGVGLAIVARVVGRHGGRVWAEGEPGRGACFSFALPLEPCARG